MYLSIISPCSRPAITMFQSKVPQSFNSHPALSLDAMLIRQPLGYTHLTVLPPMSISQNTIGNIITKYSLHPAPSLFLAAIIPSPKADPTLPTPYTRRPWTMRREYAVSTILMPASRLAAIVVLEQGSVDVTLWFIQRPSHMCSRNILGGSTTSLSRGVCTILLKPNRWGARARAGGIPCLRRRFGSRWVVEGRLGRRAEGV